MLPAVKLAAPVGVMSTESSGLFEPRNVSVVLAERLVVLDEKEMVLALDKSSELPVNVTFLLAVKLDVCA